MKQCQMFLFYVLYRAPPLRKRSLNSNKPDKTVPNKMHMQYSVEDFEKAVAAVTDDKKSIGSAAKEFNVPRKTLSGRINGRHPKNVGRPTYLTETEESSLIGYIKYMASHRFPLNIKQIRAYAWAILLRSGWPEKFCKTRPFEKWWRGFKKRHHEDITLQKPDNLDRGRAGMANSLVIELHLRKEYWKEMICLTNATRYLI